MREAALKSVIFVGVPRVSAITSRRYDASSQVTDHILDDPVFDGPQRVARGRRLCRVTERVYQVNGFLAWTRGTL